MFRRRKHKESTASPVVTQAQGPQVIPVAPTSDNPYAKPKYSPLILGQKLAQGQLPSNIEMVSSLEASKNVLLRQLQQNSLGPMGNRLLSDLETVVEDLQMLIMQKNSSERWQSFWKDYLAPNAPTGTKVAVEGVKSGQAQAKAQQYTTQVRSAVTNVSSTARLLVSSSEFRSLLLDIFRFIQNTTREELRRHGQNISGGLKSELAADVDRPPERTLQDTRAKARTLAKEITGDILQGNLPVDQESKEQILYHFRETLSRLAKDENFHRAFNSLFVIFDSMVHDAQKLSQSVQVVGDQPQTQQTYHSLWTDFSKILGEFVGYRYLARFNTDFTTLYKEMKGDYETSRWFTDVRSYMEESLKRPELLQEEGHIHKSEELFKRGRFVGNKWKNHNILDRTVKDVQKIFNNLTNDPLLIKFTKDIQQLTSDMFLNQNGRFDLNSAFESIRTLRFIAVPLILEQLETFPLPRVEGKTKKYEYVFDNMVLYGKSILPENIDIQIVNHMNIDSHASPNSRSALEVVVTMSNLDIFMKDVAFLIKKNRGFPHINDEGLVDVTVRGGPAFMSIVWRVESEQGKPFFFRLVNATCHISSVKTHFTTGKHKAMFNTMTTLFGGSIRSRMNLAIEQRIVRAFDTLNAKLNEMSAMRWENHRVSWLKRPLRPHKTEKEKVPKPGRLRRKGILSRRKGQQAATGAVIGTPLQQGVGMEQGIPKEQRQQLVEEQMIGDVPKEGIRETQEAETQATQWKEGEQTGLQHGAPVIVTEPANLVVPEEIVPVAPIQTSAPFQQLPPPASALQQQPFMEKPLPFTQKPLTEQPFQQQQPFVEKPLEEPGIIVDNPQALDRMATTTPSSGFGAKKDIVPIVEAATASPRVPQKSST